MQEEFGTVSVKRNREIEAVRTHYKQHRDALLRLAAEAPTEHLAGEYHRLVHQIEVSLVKLDELEGRRPAATPVPPVDRNDDTHPLAPEPRGPGSRPISHTVNDTVYSGDVPSGSKSRVAAMMVIGALVLGVIGWVIWSASSGSREERTVVTEETAVTETVAPVVPEPPPVVLAVQPPSADYGTIRKGTRAVRQYEITNNTDEPMTVEVTRSACRCLYYDYGNVVPPRGKELLTVTVDGAKAKAGALQETVKVTSKNDPSTVATFDVIATIK